MDDDADAPLQLNNAAQFPYAVIGVPWSSILRAAQFAGPAEHPNPPVEPGRMEGR